jgi:hypothetical protein
MLATREKKRASSLNCLTAYAHKKTQSKKSKKNNKFRVIPFDQKIAPLTINSLMLTIHFNILHALPFLWFRPF